MTDSVVNTETPVVEEKAVVPNANLAIYFKNIYVTIDSGYYRYGTVGSIPTAVLSTDPLKFRMWTFNLTFQLYPQESNVYTITVDGKEIDPKPVTIVFEDELTGTVCLKSKVLNAYKCVTYSWSQDNPFVIILRFTSPCIIRKPTLVNFNVNINDGNASPTCPCTSQTNCVCGTSGYPSCDC